MKKLITSILFFACFLASAQVAQISAGESGSSVRSKLNNIITFRNLFPTSPSVANGQFLIADGNGFVSATTSFTKATLGISTSANMSTFLANNTFAEMRADLGVGSGLANLEDSGSNVTESGTGTGYFEWDFVRIDGNVISGPLGVLNVTANTALSLNASGGNISFNPSTDIVDFNSSRITEVAEPTTGTDAATRNYVDNSVRTDKVTISSGEMSSLHNTPITIVAAGGAGTFIQVMSVYGVYNYGTVAYNAENINLRYNSITNYNLGIQTQDFNQTNDFYTTFSLFSGSTNNQFAVNQGLNLTASANLGAGDGTFDVYVTYRIVTL